MSIPLGNNQLHNCPRVVIQNALNIDIGENRGMEFSEFEKVIQKLGCDMVEIKRENKRVCEPPTIVKTFVHVDGFRTEDRPICVGKYYELVQKLDPKRKHKRVRSRAKDHKQNCQVK